MKVCIIGGGNIGTLLVAEFAYRGMEVSVYSERAGLWSDRIEVFDASDRLLMSAGRFRATCDLSEAVADADQIWITVPSFMFPRLGALLQPIVRRGQTIMVVPGTGGAEFAFAGLLEKGCFLGGIQRVHSIARLKEYGHSVYMLGRKTELDLASIPCGWAKDLARQIEPMLELPCHILPNYLCVTLTPSNPILHTSRLYSMFSDWESNRVYDRNFLFYEEWTDDSSRILLKCDDELQAICNSFEQLDLKSVRSLRKHYESATPEQMTAKIRSIKAFKGLTSPMCQTSKGWVPDFSSRYFTADFSFGLKIICDIARCTGTDAEMLDTIWTWYLNASHCDPKDYFELPLMTKQELAGKYLVN